jgi:hypothetical protein
MRELTLRDRPNVTTIGTVDELLAGPWLATLRDCREIIVRFSDADRDRPTVRVDSLERFRRDWAEAIVRLLVEHGDQDG